MITFLEGDVRFNYRVAGVAVRDGRVLLHKADFEDFWSLPGGRAEVLEAARETLVREMREEIRAEVEIRRLLWVVESFFDFMERTYHELGLYFLMEIPAGATALADTFEGEDAGVGLTFRWFRMDELGEERILPAFLAEGLRSLPDHPVHVVSDERGPA